MKEYRKVFIAGKDSLTDTTVNSVLRYQEVTYQDSVGQISLLR